ncbi:phosphatidylglycerophosphate synthase [Actinoplanes lutulentus]|uniref:CDP-alcohol phosphatidyltransferase-like enzyme n=1 Tax=Actinoplanes lutulentus TaxID=1287878 RepID=A0A327ZP22_9ACTN|nr:CDP-alcohol phosphatidyltransferase family protein [Actinoplanes lutulentus]MBB2944490.1 phosphatidylglycerophosphate synthase [Actinoplanes lutulentus]RAK42278.1 CDP-alcohol phosphatidyltransferase-like enzyme [Actinoplanes lutulentus]
MAQRPTLAVIRERTYKRRDAWWTVWLVDPLASRLVWLVAPWRWVTPNRLTIGAFFVGLGSAYCFWQQDYTWLVAGAVLYHLSFVLDCMDGKIARLNGTGSLFGTWLDYVFDRLRVLACAIGLFGGQYLRTEEVIYPLLATLVIFMDMFRYLNALQMSRVKLSMKDRLLEAAQAAGTKKPEFVEETDEETPAYPDADPTQSAVDVHGDFRTKFSLFVRIRNLLLRQRIRAHVFSGIEFMMFVFIVGPVIGQIVATTIASSALLLAFEALLVFKLWTTTKTFNRRLKKLQAKATTDQAPALV